MTKRKKLVIISATPITKLKGSNSYKVFEPTLREIEFVASLFDEIVWYGFPSNEENSNLYRIPKSSKIAIKPFPNAIGGKTVLKKLTIVPLLPLLLVKIGCLFYSYNYIHTRGPSLPALIAIVFGKIFNKKKIWHKYAGNWNQLNPPFSYRIQRHWLRNSTHPVTINGHWGDTNKKIHSFENPCFSEAELSAASTITRSYESSQFTVAFVGRVEFEKGVHLVIDAAKQLPITIRWLIVGAGKDTSVMEKLGESHTNIFFAGALGREELVKVYKQSHLVILPSAASEGFPKVISEACGFGCIPIVSNVSAMSQYIKADFGVILNTLESQEIVKTVNHLQQIDLVPMVNKAIQFAQLFTYERFVERIRNEIFLENV
jgi:glycosyltransferase involved in cell wall biosynthesis